MVQGIEVKKSDIHGKGVFATKDFKKGDVVIEWKNSKEISIEEFEKLPENEKVYVSKVEETLVWFQEPERYVNHSCEPNTKSVIGKEIAVKNIKKGEEITADYCKENPDFDFFCKCGSDDCISKKD